MSRRLVPVALLVLAPGAALAEFQGQPANPVAIGLFTAFVIATLGITYWAASRTRTARDFYTAGAGISGFQNGLAIAGDYMSAASFLGISALVFASGYDGLIYAIGFLAGWPIITFLVAEPLRNLGKYTFADVVSFRLRQSPVRTLAACGSLAVVAFYLIAQMVGAGKLIELLFGLPYAAAVIVVGTLMILYVSFGGMLATTWVQIVKAVLLLAGAGFMAVAVLYAFEFSLERLFAAAVETHPKGQAIMRPGGLVDDPVDAISLGIALLFGTAGLPHVLMRFFTVANAKEARKSVFFATGFIGCFYLLTFIIGFGAIVLVARNPDFLDPAGGLIGGDNMAAVHLAEALGGNVLLGFISAVAFATILAVVSGLTLAGASAISHDLYAGVIARGRSTEQQEMRISRLAVVVLGVVAIVLGIAFEEQNIAFMVGLAFAIAASANFPVLFLAIFWPRLTTRGAVVGGFVGLITAAVLVVLGPAVWVEVFGNAEPIFPSRYPALYSVTAAFACIWLFSMTDRSPRAQHDRQAFAAQDVRCQTGIGADGALAP